MKKENCICGRPGNVLGTRPIALMILLHVRKWNSCRIQYIFFFISDLLCKHFAALFVFFGNYISHSVPIFMSIFTLLRNQYSKIPSFSDHLKNRNSHRIQYILYWLRAPFFWPIFADFFSSLLRQLAPKKQTLHIQMPEAGGGDTNTRNALKISQVLSFRDPFGRKKLPKIHLSVGGCNIL